MKPALTLIALLLSLTLWAEKTTKRPPIPGLYVKYTSSTKTIIIKKDSIYVQEWIDQFDNPMSSVPSSRKEVVKKALVPSTKIAELKALILKKDGFMSLPKNEYGAKATDRFYPYTISVVYTNFKEQRKEVVYRSNPAPDTEQAPQAFTEVEKKINEIVEGIWK